MDEYQLKHTKKYEGAYTQEEVELNIKLYEACSKEEIDAREVEELLLKGADPLGATAISGWNLLDHVYEILVCESQSNDSVNLPIITELFLKHGMDINNPRVPYDGDNSTHPLWSYAFISSQHSIKALKLLLDAGLDADSAYEFWNHAIYDHVNIVRENPNDDRYNKYYVWTIKMMMLIASYKHILDEEETFRDFIKLDINNFDLSMFRNWDDFDVEFDTSRCIDYPELYRSIVNIYFKKTGECVWRFGICIDELD